MTDSPFAELFPDQVPPQHRGDDQDPVEGHAEHRHPVVEGGAAVRPGQPVAAVKVIRSDWRSGGREGWGDLKNECTSTGDRQTEPVSSSINCRDNRSTLSDRRDVMGVKVLILKPPSLRRKCRSSGVRGGRGSE